MSNDSFKLYAINHPNDSTKCTGKQKPFHKQKSITHGYFKNSLKIGKKNSTTINVKVRKNKHQKIVYEPKKTLDQISYIRTSYEI